MASKLIPAGSYQTVRVVRCETDVSKQEWVSLGRLVLIPARTEQIPAMIITKQFLKRRLPDKKWGPKFYNFPPKNDFFVRSTLLKTTTTTTTTHTHTYTHTHTPKTTTQLH